MSQRQKQSCWLQYWLQQFGPARQMHREKPRTSRWMTSRYPWSDSSYPIDSCRMLGMLHNSSDRIILRPPTRSVYRIWDSRQPWTEYQDWQIMSPQLDSRSVWSQHLINKYGAKYTTYQLGPDWSSPTTRPSRIVRLVGDQCGGVSTSRESMCSSSGTAISRTPCRC